LRWPATLGCTLNGIRAGQDALPGSGGATPSTAHPLGRRGGHHRRPRWWLGRASAWRCAQSRMRPASVAGLRRIGRGCEPTNPEHERPWRRTRLPPRWPKQCLRARPARAVPLWRRRAPKAHCWPRSGLADDRGAISATLAAYLFIQGSRPSFHCRPGLAVAQPRVAALRPAPDGSGLRGWTTPDRAQARTTCPALGANKTAVIAGQLSW